MSLSRAQRKDRKRRELIERGKPRRAKRLKPVTFSFDPNQVTVTINGLALRGFGDGRMITMVNTNEEFGTRVHHVLNGQVFLGECYGPPRYAFADPVNYVAAWQYEASARKTQRWLGEFVLDDEQLLDLFMIVVMEQARLARADTTGNGRRKRLLGQARALARWLDMTKGVMHERGLDEGVLAVLHDCVLERRWDEVEELRGRLVRPALRGYRADQMIVDDAGEWFLDPSVGVPYFTP